MSLEMKGLALKVKHWKDMGRKKPWWPLEEVVCGALNVKPASFTCCVTTGMLSNLSVPPL